MALVMLSPHTQHLVTLPSLTGFSRWGPAGLCGSDTKNLIKSTCHHCCSQETEVLILSSHTPAQTTPSQEATSRLSTHTLGDGRGTRGSTKPFKINACLPAQSYVSLSPPEGLLQVLNDPAPSHAPGNYRLNNSSRMVLLRSCLLANSPSLPVSA